MINMTQDYICRCPRCQKIEDDAEEYYANSKKTKDKHKLINDINGEQDE